MSDFHEKFPSKYIKAADLGQTRPIVTINRVEDEMVGAGISRALKLVAYFNEPRIKPLVLNKTNCEAIARIAGCADTEDWAGTRVMLYATTVLFQSSETPCVRIAAAPKPKTAPQRVAAPPTDDGDAVPDFGIDEVVL
jgi:hypothetical protein